MDLLLILTYASICVAIFKVFRIPLNKWTVPTAVLGGVVLIGALLLLMNYNHPYSEITRQYFVTEPVIAEVRGRVIEVPVKANTPVEAGDILFRIDPEPFEDKIADLQASLKLATTNLERAQELLARNLGTQVDVDRFTSEVESYQARIELAKFDLENTVVRAPSAGYVTQLVLRPGMMALPLAIRPVMQFVPKENVRMWGWFRQNYSQRLEPGYEAEVILDAVPGVIFAAEVVQIVPVIAEGQIQPELNAQFRSVAQERIPGRVAVEILITDPAFREYTLPAGVFGQTAIYTEHFHHVSIIRRVLLRMAAWMNYVLPLH